MSEKEKEFIEKLDKAMPNLSEYDKGYILGVAETRASMCSDESYKKEDSE